MKNSNLKPFPKLEFDTRRKQVKFCPCGRDNKDGKFCPYKGYYDKGYCFSCEKTFLPGIDGESISPKVASSPKLFKRANSYSFISPASFVKTLNDYEHNNFVLFLNELFGVTVANELVARYFIGTSNHWSNATIFWQLANEGDSMKKVRTGKIIQYNIVPSKNSFIGKDCKRNKTNLPPVKWMHKFLKQDDYNLLQCLFGEHLLQKDSHAAVAIVESEKTAVIASAYFPNFIFLAAGSLTNLKLSKCEVLKGRKIILFPDLNGFELWTRKAEELSSIARVTVSDLLHRKASEEDRKSGLDLADYLIRFDYKTFKQ